MTRRRRPPSRREAWGCRNFVSNKPVFLDLVLSPDCPSTTRHLLNAAIGAIKHMEREAASARTSVVLSFSVVGAPSPNINKVSDSEFISSVYAACAQQSWISPDLYFINSTSPLFTYMDCLFGNLEVARDDLQSSYCLYVFPQHEAQSIAQCAKGNDMIVASRAFSRSFPVKSLASLPLLFIDGKRFCGEWTVDAIANATCAYANNSDPIRVSTRSASWPTPRVVSNMDQSCPSGNRFPGDDGLACVEHTESALAVLELVPVVGLFCLAFGACLISCVIVLRRNMRQRQRLLEQQRVANASVEQGEPMSISEILQILANLVERDGPQNAGRHRELVERNLKRYSDKVTEAPELESCTICLEPVNVYFNLPCGHAFHKHCLRAWLVEGKFDCPVCRQVIITDVSPFSSSPATASAPPQQRADGADQASSAQADARREQILALF